MTRTRALFASALAATLAAVALVATRPASATAEPAPDPRIAVAAANVAAYCDALKDDATNAAARATRVALCQMWRGEYADLTRVSPTPTASPAPTTAPPTSTPPATTTPPPSTTPPATTATPTPTVTPPPGRVKPDATNTGIPVGTTLTPYTGPCVITSQDAAIDAKVINCRLEIRTTGVVITNSLLKGGINADENSAIPVGFTLTRSRVETPVGMTGVGATNFVADGVEIVGGNRSGYCFANCTFIRVWAHDQYVPPTSDQHASGLRFDHDAQIIDSRVSCDALDNPAEGGCSASITGYPDWGPVRDVVIRGNWIEPTPGYFCAYGGSTAGKPGSSHALNATGMEFTGNVFSRGPSGTCGNGGPITDWNPEGVGNVWTGNVFDDGAAIPNVCSARACE